MWLPSAIAATFGAVTVVYLLVSTAALAIYLVLQPFENG